ncbi:hypothetical protein ACHWQZ_G007246 [Mnemiopsis leidyi]
MSHPRILSRDEKEKLDKEKNLSDFQRTKLEADAKKNWDLFYKRNADHFFKDRHWLTREFKVIRLLHEEGGGTVFEVGCGVGNTIYPLRGEFPNLFFYGCDLSPRAVDLVKGHLQYDPEKISCFQSDITNPDPPLTQNIPPQSVDLITLIYVLSAIAPEKMSLAIQNIKQVLKPGGVVILRDYGLYDHAMLRFKSGHKIQENFYKRQDGTRAYYFTTEEMAALFENEGFETSFNYYVEKETSNKKEGISVPRIFVQSQFRLRSQSNTS